MFVRLAGSTSARGPLGVLGSHPRRRGFRRRARSRFHGRRRRWRRRGLRCRRCPRCRRRRLRGCFRSCMSRGRWARLRGRRRGFGRGGRPSRRGCWRWCFRDARDRRGKRDFPEGGGRRCFCFAGTRRRGCQRERHHSDEQRPDRETNQWAWRHLLSGWPGGRQVMSGRSFAHRQNRFSCRGGS